MEKIIPYGLYFVYQNYPYIIAAYGYCKVISTSYEGISAGVSVVSKLYSFVRRPKRDNSKVDEIKIIEPLDNVLILTHEEDYEIFSFEK